MDETIEEGCCDNACVVTEALLHQRLFAATLLGAPLACCLLCNRPVVAPRPDEATLAFSDFLSAAVAARFSLPSFTAASLAAFRASGLCARRSLMTSRDAPTMAL